MVAGGGGWWWEAPGDDGEPQRPVPVHRFWRRESGPVTTPLGPLKLRLFGGINKNTNIYIHVENIYIYVYIYIQNPKLNSWYMKSISSSQN